MQQNGVSTTQVVKVRGYADQRLRKPDKPEDASNRRISVIVQYLVKGKEDGKDPGDHGKENALPKRKPTNLASRPGDYWLLKRCRTRYWHECPQCSCRLRCPLLPQESHDPTSR
jgi:hypothetical protein